MLPLDGSTFSLFLSFAGVCVQEDFDFIFSVNLFVSPQNDHVKMNKSVK